MSNASRSSGNGRHAPLAAVRARRRSHDVAMNIFLWLAIVAILVFAFAPWF